MRKHGAVAVMIGCVVAAGLVMPGCSKKGAGGGDADIAGVYTLVSVDGNELPAQVSHQGVILEVLSGTFTIRTDGTVESKTVFVPPAGSEVAREATARYTRMGSKLTMRWQGAGITVGTMEGDTFTMDNEGMEFVYRK